ncbi:MULTISPECIES: C40 family peptidase [unclassified Motilimonas]|uniref:C40 family peptidase n=1 Tax=Motilimonas TaxID=1914248 RepID=UPI001E63F20F|nr:MULTISPECIES: C40 family peptidase [unclassified Motilimonas]MCE0557156.1 C40 family peptidase [Motilimonas sp. E26]MDO6524391.1 C40 family peptidase [Motilimonas sp. 1_MG-2023]
MSFSALKKLPLIIALLVPTSFVHASSDIIDFARQFKGTEYVWGGASPSGFDCSGYIKYVYNEFDISIPRVTRAYHTLFDREVPLEEAQVGDLIVFTGTDAKIRQPGHAGIISEIDEGKLMFLHSSSSKKHFGVSETNYYKSGYPKRFLKIIRMTDNESDS